MPLSHQVCDLGGSFVLEFYFSQFIPSGRASYQDTTLIVPDGDRLRQVGGGDSKRVRALDTKRTFPDTPAIGITDAEGRATASVGCGGYVDVFATAAGWDSNAKKVLVENEKQFVAISLDVFPMTQY